MNNIYLFTFCSHLRYVCIVNYGNSGGRREIPGIRFGIASNDGSWFAAFRRGTSPGVSRVVIYTRYILRTHLGLLQGFRVTYVATWREKTIFEDISSTPIARWSRTRGRCLFRRERRQILPTERILKSRLNDFHGTRDARKKNGSRSGEEVERCFFLYADYMLDSHFTTLSSLILRIEIFTHQLRT